MSSKEYSDDYETDSNTTLLGEQDTSHHSRSNRTSFLIIALITLLAANLTLFLLNIRTLAHRQTTFLGLTYSPAASAVSYSVKKAYSGNHSAESPFSGPPTPDNIKAWEDLVEPMFFAATESDLLRADEDLDSSVKLADGGYVAALGVYHELHCVRRLRLFLFSDTFYPRLTDANIKYLQGHLGHCLESIRQSLMCTGDLSVYTFHWTPEDTDRPHPKTNARRKCVNWESVHDWAMERRVGFDPLLLREDGDGKGVRVHM